MPARSQFRVVLRASVFAAVALTSDAFAQTPVATYTFGGSLDPLESTAPPLAATDPLGRNDYTTADVFARCMLVYRTRGAAKPVESQAGLTLATPMLASPDTYSIEMVFRFFDGDDRWRLILDTHNRGSDAGFYVRRTSNTLNMYDDQTMGQTVWINGAFHHVVLTVTPPATPNSPSTVSAYLDGFLEFTLETNIMNLDNNPGRFINLFLDNTEPDGLYEYSDAEIALLRLYDRPLSHSEVETLAVDPFALFPCTADMNKDGFVDAIDLSHFDSEFFDSAAGSDFNCDSFIDASDYDDFVRQLIAGC